MCQLRTLSFGSKPDDFLSGIKLTLYRIPRLQGGSEATLSGITELTATTNRQAWARPPIDVDFQVLMLTASGLSVRYLKVFEKSNYHSVKWVRYLTKASGTYQIRVSFTPEGNINSLNVVHSRYEQFNVECVDAVDTHFSLRIFDVITLGLRVPTGLRNHSDLHRLRNPTMSSDDDAHHVDGQVSTVSQRNGKAKKDKGLRYSGRIPRLGLH